MTDGNGEFTTAHSLFGIPVILDEEEFDCEVEYLKSSILPGTERYELLHSAKLIVWDEFLSNHKHCFDSAYNIMNGFEGKVVLCMGDCKQIAPVVRNRDPAFTILASMTRSPHWSKFKVVTFTKNMRLSSLQVSLTSTNNL